MWGRKSNHEGRHAARQVRPGRHVRVAHHRRADQRPGHRQSALAAALGYDTTDISMLENGRRVITDEPTLRRVTHNMGLPPHVLSVTDPADAGFISMIKFGESTIRLARVARESGQSAEAINELWPLIRRLEARLAEGHADHAAAQLLGQARAMLGVALGNVLPEESLASAARWTGRALSRQRTQRTRPVSHRNGRRLNASRPPKSSAPRAIGPQPPKHFCSRSRPRRAHGFHIQPDPRPRHR
ncbi:helix-turn-helix transcriptional regulator [Nonomuraea sp. MG754425]|nr:helix-turn-helix transcriptional regulator [Nonomuraea sp. MG754425]